ncbi:methyl-accepting chemotaxis protein, partial [Kineococcus glutinatus]|uniref:methyl-accepting chemotaxis protein n=1 Tax=Kineococcus glutinatus TaxID=1070872 RepID=UPI0031EF8416
MAHLRNLRVAVKLVAAFAAVGALLLVIVAVALVRLGDAQRNLTTLSTSGVGSVRAIGEMQTAFQTARLDLVNLALVTDPQRRQELEAVIAEHDAALDEVWESYGTTGPAVSAADRDEFTHDIRMWRETRDGLLPLALGGDTDAFAAQRDARLTGLSTEMAGDLATFATAEDTAAKAIAAEGASDHGTATALLLGLAAGALATAAALTALITRSVAGPLAAAVAVVRGLAEGRLDQRVPVTSRDEVGELAGALNSTMDRLGAVLRDVTADAETLAASSGELTAVASRLAAGAEDSAAQTRVVSAATEQIGANIGTVAAAGEEMTAAITEIAASTAQASQTAATAVASAGAAEATIQRLSSSSREIGEVVQLITSIAEQTNLLALNA